MDNSRTGRYPPPACWKGNGGLKRAFDISAAVFGLLVFALPMLALGLLIRRESPGPAIFRQMRVGQHEATFRCYKLRTMADDAPNVPTHEASSHAITPLGLRLRRLKADELPQLWNVLKGEMSLVGPRPCLPSQTALIEARRRRGVFALRPGVTGLAQIEGIDMSDPERLARRDADYLRDRTFLLDLRILLATVFGRGRGDRVVG